MTFGFVDRRSIRLSYWRKPEKGTRRDLHGSSTPATASPKASPSMCRHRGHHTLWRESVEAVLAVIVGVAFGSALAALVALPLRRRRQASQDARPERNRRIPLDRPEQRIRAAWVATGFAFTATALQAAGATLWAAYFMLGALTLGLQAGVSALLVRLRDR